MNARGIARYHRYCRRLLKSVSMVEGRSFIADIFGRLMRGKIYRSYLAYRQVEYGNSEAKLLNAELTRRVGLKEN